MYFGILFRSSRFPRRAFIPIAAIASALAALCAASAAGGDTAADGQANPDAGLPEPVTEAHFTALTDQSPFLRSIGLSQSIVVTGFAELDEEIFASLFNLETRESFFVGEETSPEGWQLVGINGDRSDLETLSARIKIAGSEVVSIRYEKLPANAFQKGGSSGGSGKSGGGGGTGPHGGPDPRVLTPDQMADARKAAENYREGFHADGYPDKPPASTVAKLSRLSTEQREAINVKMYEYRNRGLNLPERAKIYESIIDKTLQSGR